MISTKGLEEEILLDNKKIKQIKSDKNSDNHLEGKTYKIGWMIREQLISLVKILNPDSNNSKNKMKNCTQ